MCQVCSKERNKKNVFREGEKFIILHSLIENQMTTNVRIYFWTLDSVSLSYMSIFFFFNLVAQGLSCGRQAP